jgi:YegS/Rv2252/BmrU family lipid kinase
MAVAVIINPIAGGGTARRAGARAAQAAAALEAAGERGPVLITERPGHGRELASRAVDDGARLVIAWGGDGTVREVASALVGSDAALGIVRSGSGNGLARALGVARDPAQSIHEACRAQPSRIDAGECGGEYFFNVAGVGIDAEVARAFAGLGAGARGLSAYVRMAAGQLLHYTPRVYRIDGRPTRPALLVAVANGPQFGNGARIAPAASLVDGLLDVVVFEERSRARTMAAVPRLFTGGIARVPGVSMRKSARVRIEHDAGLAYHLDGEPRQGGTRLDVSVRPASLQVCVR